MGAGRTGALKRKALRRAAKAKYRARLAVGRPTARWRRRPDFLIIGAQRAGTTSLYASLSEQPAVHPSIAKEIHHFDQQPLRSSSWYAGHFPLDRSGIVTGEATPYLLFHPLSPEHVRAALPEVRLVAILRDPVARAWSHYQMERRWRETRPFADALEDDAQVVVDDERLARGEIAASEIHRTKSYFRRGVYLPQLLRWEAQFPREQLLVLDSAELAREPLSVLQRVADHVGFTLDEGAVNEWHSNRSGGASAPEDVAASLRERYRPHDEALAEHLGWAPSWIGAGPAPS